MYGSVGAPPRRGLPPGPRTPALAQALGYLLGGDRYIEGVRERFGATFTMRLTGLGTVVVIADPADVKTVFTAPPGALEAGAGNEPMRILLGDRSLLVLDGKEHLRERKLMLPPLHGDRLARYRERIDELTEEMVDRLPMGTTFPLLPELQRLTLDIIVHVVFGIDDPARRAAVLDRIRGLVRYAARDETGIRWALRRLGGIRFWRAFARAHARADALIYEEIARRRAYLESNPPGDDMLSLLLLARDEEGRPMTDVELRDELVTLLIAGHETTATGLAWAFEMLVHHPRAMTRATEEARAGAEEAYAAAVAQETLRLCPPVGVMARQVVRPFAVAGYELPPGVTIVPAIPWVNRDPDVYPEPERFRPERFLDRTPDTYAWIPFGGGIRRCIGASFAQFEMRRVLQVVLRRATLRAATTEVEPAVRRAIIYPPRHGARVVLEARDPRPLPSTIQEAA